MHSFHQSRGRTFFEVLCALAISLSFVGTWMQTGASALLPAAAVALFYALVHAFDMAKLRSAAPEPETVEVAADQQVAAAQPVKSVPVPEVAEVAAQVAPPARKDRQPKAPRKKAKIAELAPAEEAKIVDFVPDEEPEIVEFVPDEEPEAVVPMPLDEEPHASPTPLFEPEPFTRQQRAVFGRKAG